MTSECQDLRDQIVGLVEGDLDRVEAERLRGHADVCAACARQIALEESLVAALRALPPAPEYSVPCPDPEPSPIVSIDAARGVGGRSARFGPRFVAVATAVAVAATLLVVVGAQIAGDLRSGPTATDSRDLADSSRTVVIRTVIDSDADVALPDDDLLALTAGVEAVVMRRPARRR